MSDKILIVDDEPNVLSALRRQLRKTCQAEVDTTTHPEHVLDLIAQHGPYAVVVSDMRMPYKDGLRLLQEIKKAAPDTMRIMLTGEVNIQVAADAVNVANVFRFLSKPCSIEKLIEAISDGIDAHRQIIIEREPLSSSGASNQ